jgi:hypothetical protein
LETHFEENKEEMEDDFLIDDDIVEDVILR